MDSAKYLLHDRCEGLDDGGVGENMVYLAASSHLNHEVHIIPRDAIFLHGADIPPSLISVNPLSRVPR